MRKPLSKRTEGRKAFRLIPCKSNWRWQLEMVVATNGLLGYTEDSFILHNKKGVLTMIDFNGKFAEVFHN